MFCDLFVSLILAFNLELWSFTCVGHALAVSKRLDAQLPEAGDLSMFFGSSLMRHGSHSDTSNAYDGSETLPSFSAFHLVVLIGTFSTSSSDPDTNATKIHTSQHPNINSNRPYPHHASPSTFHLLPLARRSLMYPNPTPTLHHPSLTARPPKPAGESLVLHQRPGIAQVVRIELVPDFVGLVDFAFACDVRSVKLWENGGVSLNSPG